MARFLDDTSPAKGGLPQSHPFAFRGGSSWPGLSRFGVLQNRLLATPRGRRGRNGSLTGPRRACTTRPTAARLPTPGSAKKGPRHRHNEYRVRMSSRPSVLVCDDEPNLRELIRVSLGPRYAIVEAEDGESALALARSLRPDLVILDLMMPRLSGLDVLTELKADPALAATRVLIVTA